jgi:hypothetical protein
MIVANYENLKLSFFFYIKHCFLDSQPWINLGSKLEGQILKLIGWKEQHDHDQDKKGPKL